MSEVIRQIQKHKSAAYGKPVNPKVAPPSKTQGQFFQSGSHGGGGGG